MKSSAPSHSLPFSGLYARCAHRITHWRNQLAACQLTVGLKDSLRWQLVLGVALTHAVLVSLLVAALVRQQYNFLTEAQQQAAQGLAVSLAASSLQWVLARDVAALLELMDTIQHYPDLVYAEVLDPQQRVLGHTRRDRIGLYADIPPELHTPDTLPAAHVTQTGKHVRVIVPIHLPNQARVLGWVRLELSGARTQAALQAVTLSGLGYILLAIGIGTGFAWLLARGLIRRLAQITLLTQQVRQGGLHLRVAPERSDELGKLGENINYMLALLQQQQALLHHTMEKAEATLLAISDAVITTDAQGRIEYLNPKAQAMLGWSQTEAHGLPINALCQLFSGSTAQPFCRELQGALHIVENNSEHCLHLVNRAKQRIAVRIAATSIEGGSDSVRGLVIVLQDLSEIQAMVAQLDWHAQHDLLTQLPNRRAFEWMLEELLLVSRREATQHSLLYLDIDQFKVINDTFDHKAGDQLLRQIALLLRQSIPANDPVARLGDDEFAILLHNSDIPQAQYVAEALRLAIYELHFRWCGMSLQLSASISVTTVDPQANNASELLTAADLACIAAKKAGRNRVHVYYADDQNILQQHGEMHWLTQLQHALAHDQLCLYYQAILPLCPSAGLTPHAEVLVRLRKPDKTLVPPGVFLPAAERFNLSQQIDQWVLSRFFTAYNTHQAKMPGVWSLNLSGSSLVNREILAFIHQQLKQHTITPANICFEITESEVITNIAAAIEFINDLRRIGCKFALDDFGSGLSSFAYLKALPVDYLKIDGHFVRDIDHDATDYALVQAVHQVGNSMKLKTIAEFVETEAIRAKLCQIGVNYGQGYALARPLPLYQIWTPSAELEQF